MKKVLKILAKIFGGIIILLLIAIGILYAMQGRIIAAVVDQLEKGYNLEMKYEDVNISIFRDFPQLSLGIENLQVKETHKQTDLVKLKELDISIDFYSLLSSSAPLKVHALSLHNPLLLYEIYPDSTTNWDAFIGAQEPADTSQESIIQLSLDEYSIESGHLIYIDNTTNTSLEVINLNHKGSGVLSADKFNLDTETSIDTLKYQSQGITYVSDYPISLDARFQVNTIDGIYSFKDAQFQLAELKTLLGGEIRTIDNGYDVAVNIKEAQSDIKQLLSFLPDEMIKDYQGIQSSGKLTLSGTIQGKYLPTSDIYPAVDINLSVENGTITYPELPESISDIKCLATIKKEEGNLNQLEITINPLKFRIGNNEPISMVLSISNPMTGPHFIGRAEGTINLTSLNAAIPLQEIKSMSGEIYTDLRFDINYPDIKAADYEKVHLSGNLNITGATIQTRSYPLVTINRLKSTLSEKELNITEFSVLYGKSDFNGTLLLEEPFTYFNEELPVVSHLSINSHLIDLNQLSSDAETTTTVDSTSSTDLTSINAFYERLVMDIDLKADKVLYSTYVLENIDARAHIEDSVFKLVKMSVNYLDNNYAVNGFFNNVVNYMLSDDGVLNGNIELKGKKFNLWKYLNSGESSSGEVSTAMYALPDNMNLKINAQLDNVSYETYTLEALNTALELNEQKLTIYEGTASLFNGKVELTGTFEADGTGKPSYDFNYTMKSIDFSSIYTQMPTFRKIAPIAQFIEGDFQTSIQISGLLEQSLYPDLNSINAVGIIKTLDAQLKGFKPLNAIAQKLNLNSHIFQAVDISNTKNYFTIKEGEFIVKPFPVQLKEMQATIQGSHQILGKSIDYKISTIIPRKWLNENAVTSNVNTGIEWVEAQAQQFGLDLNAGSNLYVDILLSGSITDPHVGLQLKNIAGQSIEESVKQSIQDKTQEIQDSIRRAIEKERKELEKAAQKRIDSLKQAAEKAAREKAKEILTGKPGNSDAEIKEEIKKSKEAAEKKINEIKDKYGDWNPFD